MSTQILRLGTVKDVAQFQEQLKQRQVAIPCDAKIVIGRDSPLRTAVDRAGLRIGNRIAVQPMEGWDGRADGNPTENTIRRWRRFDGSGAKLTWGGEVVAVTAEGRANPHQLQIAPHTIASVENRGIGNAQGPRQAESLQKHAAFKQTI